MHLASICRPSRYRLTRWPGIYTNRYTMSTSVAPGFGRCRVSIRPFGPCKMSNCASLDKLPSKLCTSKCCFTAIMNLIGHKLNRCCLMWLHYAANDSSPTLRMHSQGPLAPVSTCIAVPISVLTSIHYAVGRYCWQMARLGRRVH